jgi:1-acyl-sn-glycerol-3-phosphate acyltransferase
MIVWMLVYFVSLIFRKHSKERALALRLHYLKYLAVPLLGLKIHVKGKPINRSALYVSNHRSFTDPIVICRYLKAFVVAKAEVASYPIINYGAQLTGVLYVKREDKSSRSSVRQMIIDTIENGYNILVFPEGTVGLKKGILDLRKGAFAEAIKNGIPIIPIAIEYKRPNALWLKANFVVQFLDMFATPITEVKLEFGDELKGKSVDETVKEVNEWYHTKLTSMQNNWSEIDYHKYQND